LKRSKKVLVVASTYPRWESDSESRFVHQKCKGLTEWFDVVVCAPWFEGSKEYEVMDGVRVYRFKYAGNSLCYGAGMYYNFKHSLKNKLALPSFLWNNYKKIRWIIKNERIKTVVGWWAFPTGFLLGINKILHKQDYVLSLGGTDIFTVGKNRLVKFALKHAKKLVALSQPLADTAKIICLRDVEVIHIGTDFEKQEGNKERGKVLLCVGRLVEQKGFQYVIENLPEGFELRIAGEGTYRKELEELSEGKNVRFLGALNKEQLIEEYKSAGLFILPSEKGTESLGIVCAEALLCGCPVLARDTGGVSDLIVDGSTGILFKDNEEISKIINNVFEYYDFVPKLIENGQEHIEANFRWPGIVELWKRLLA